MMTDDMLGAVLVGCGLISKVWLDAIKEMPQLRVVGLVDLQEEAARSRAEQYGLADALVSSDLESVLEHTRPDMVFDCTVPDAHLGVTLTALRRGCHVLGEKPIADTLEHARQMVAAAQAAGRLYAVIQNRRYDPNIRALCRCLESGVFGPITTVNSDFYIGAHFGGFRDRMEHVLLLDMAIHTFDAARLISGADPVSVYCQEWNPSGSWYDHDASAVALFEMTDGIVYTYRGSWCAEGLNTTWESEWRIVGQTGSVKWDGGTGIQAQVVAERGGFISKWRDVAVPPYHGADKVGGHAGLIREFLGCVKSGAIPETICTDNIKSLAMVFGAIESAQTGKVVRIESE
jgi:predicted dehydrogenase